VIILCVTIIAIIIGLPVALTFRVTRNMTDDQLNEFTEAMNQHIVNEMWGSHDGRC
jgi:hypothetical protein